MQSFYRKQGTVIKTIRALAANIIQNIYMETISCIAFGDASPLLCIFKQSKPNNFFFVFTFFF